MGSPVNLQTPHQQASPDLLLLPITAVERETGVSKELLRMWERRYGFPQPLRDAMGDRVYTLEQVTRLRLMRRLIDIGFRPGKLVAFETVELERMLASQSKARHAMLPELEQELLQVLRTHQPDQVREYVAHQLTRLGLERFVLDFLQHAQVIIGDAWMRGQLDVHEEHLFTDQVQTQMRAAISCLREPAQPPRVMLTTPPGEQHGMGLLMVESLLRLDDAEAFSFGVGMGHREVAQAAKKQRMNIVAISFSAAYPVAKAIEYLEELRFQLPLAVEVWGGGSGLRSTRRSIEAVRFFHDLPSLRHAVADWRQTHRH